MLKVWTSKIMLVVYQLLNSYLDRARVGDNGLELDSVDQRLAQRDVLDARIIKAIYIIPDYIKVNP